MQYNPRHCIYIYNIFLSFILNKSEMVNKQQKTVLHSKPQSQKTGWGGGFNNSVQIANFTMTLQLRCGWGQPAGENNLACKNNGKCVIRKWDVPNLRQPRITIHGISLSSCIVNLGQRRCPPPLQLPLRVCCSLELSSY